MDHGSVWVNSGLSESQYVATLIVFTLFFTVWPIFMVASLFCCLNLQRCTLYHVQFFFFYSSRL